MKRMEEKMYCKEPEKFSCSWDVCVTLRMTLCWSCNKTLLEVREENCVH